MTLVKNNFLRRLLWSVCLGNFFEHYDTALFGFLSPFLAPQIFPQQEPLTALILTYAMIPLGMLARPIGSLVFGYIGDLRGRGQALFIALLGMGIVSGLIAFTPMYAQVGMISPVVFGLGRVLQNFFAAGEITGGVVFLLENTPQKRQDWISGLYSASTVGGIILACGAVSLLASLGKVDAGWRLLYLLGSVTAFFGCMMRRHFPAKVSARFSYPGFFQTMKNFSSDLWVYRKPFLWIVLSSGFSYANYSMALVLMNGFIPLVSPVTAIPMVNVNLLLLVFDFCVLPVFGYMSSRISREKMMLLAALCVVCFAMPLCAVLRDASLMTIIGIRLCLVILGVAFCAPFYAWMQQLVPAAYRYTVLSFGYAVGSQLLGGQTAAISLWCFKKTGLVWSVSWYWILLALVSCITVIYSKKYLKIEVHREQQAE